jgi:GT2 family glycosyltransferase
LLSIIIVNFRSADLVLDSIRTLEQFNSGLVYEVIVVDNHSGDNSREMVTSQFPGTRFIEMEENAGFARANNIGMKAAGGEVFLLLNPDTISIDDSIARAYRQLLSTEYLACGIQQLDADREPQISGNFFMKGGINHILPIPYWGNFLRWLGYRFKTKIPNVKQASSIEEVDWISGAFLMIKKQAVEKAGMMDEDFFLYAEEVEWCSRLRKFGKLCIFGYLKIIHLEGGSIDKAQEVKEKGYYNLYDRKGLQLMVSNHLRVKKQYGNGWFFFLLLNYTWGVFVYFLFSTFHRLLSLKNPFGEWGRIGSFASNIARLWALSPKIISGKPYFYKMF